MLITRLDYISVWVYTRDMNNKQNEDKVWNDAIYKSYESKVRTALIEFSDALDWKDTREQRDAFNKAFGELMRLFTNI